MQQSFLSTLNQALTKTRSAGRGRHLVDSDADDDRDEQGPQRRPSGISLETIKSELLGTLKTNLFSAGITGDKETQSPVEPAADTDRAPIKSNAVAKTSTARPRRNTLPNLGTGSSNVQTPSTEHRKRKGHGKTLFGRSFLSLTQREATARKWGYAIYTYSVLVLLILGPIRNLIGRYALDGHEPFGWAIGYLFGNVQRLRFFVWEWNLEWWVPLPPLQDVPNPGTVCQMGRAEHLRHMVLSEANTRLLLCAWCLAIIAVGLGVVLSFTFVEVDTRRKVFHFMMVAMLLPTIFIDPAFISLALVLILALFLILDLIRASQLPPLSRPIASFLTPYVDGRDLRGPVVVSHIFLLIGCAVPLWLSLAGMQFLGDEPWRNWEVAKRDVSMIAGVVCVGMGDAAASLIGRRYGRRKWPWTGGKSLEGSAAFAFAVTVGLLAAKLWLRVGQWEDMSKGAHDDAWSTVASKAGVAACGASFMEAVLTGGNDNVVVPVVLWLLVKALEV
jgi:dolichol kinase